MASLTAIRDGLQVRLATIPGLRAYATLRSEVTPPVVMVAPSASSPISYDSTMARGADDFRFTLILVVSKSWDTSAQENLDAYLAGSGPSSIKQAVEADMSLGGVVDYARVAEVSSYGEITIGTVQYIGAEITAEVKADGSV